MLRSMYSGISGMKVNQTKLDVIGNNIANVNTTGFKSSRARFADTLNQNVSDAMAPSQNSGGVNASQVGLGVQLASIDSVMTQGSMQTTGRALDVAIDGNGFFMISNGPKIVGDGTLEVSNRGNHTVTDQSLQTSGAQLMYSRDGSFIRDTDGSLLTGDGFRVMGYSLTNDDSSMAATAKSSSPVTDPANLKISFGPGSQLNGYKVVLGAIGSGTPTTSDIDKINKRIIINGDFSDTSSLNSEQIESAVNKGLSASGISQSIYVSGKVGTYSNLAADGIKGGTDNTAPDRVPFAGFTIKLTEGASLNDYSFEIGEVAAPALTASVNVSDKKIIINGDFINNAAFSASDLKDVINKALSDQAVISPELGTQKIDTLTGTRTNFANLTATSGVAVVSVAPTLSGDKAIATVPAVDFLGFTFPIDAANKGNDLNGYSIQIKKSTGLPAVNVDTGSKAIVISGDVSTLDATTLPTFNTNLLAKLKASNIKDASFQVAGTYVAPVPASDNSAVAYYIGGVDSKSPSVINLGGLDLEFPLPEELMSMVPPASGTNYLDKLEFVIGDINQVGPVTVDIDPLNAKRIIVKGNFSQVNGVTKADLQTAINSKLGLTGVGQIVVSGQSKVYAGITSDPITGGEDLKGAGAVVVNGLTFQPVVTSGSALNDYKIRIGTVTEGTPTSTKIDETAKTITINGDFVSANGITALSIQRALTKAFSASSLGNNVGIDVSGTPIQVNNAASEVTTGGTPVQSISTDGIINYVDATKDIKAYDSCLKSLMIPDKIRVPGTDTMIAVKTYTISASGVINATLDDGTVAALGQIALVNFKNPEGLTKLGGNLYNGSVNSGEAAVMTGLGTLGEDNSKAFGVTRQNMLEMANVDLAEQFTDMIVATRAFQASSKMISTGDEILTEIISLKR